MAGIDVNRTTAGITLTPEQSAEIWSGAEYASAALQLAQRVDLPGSGLSVDIITGEPEAEWVGETNEKPVDRPTFSSKLMTPYTMAVIVPFSNQFRRDKARLYAEVVRKLPQALAKKLDKTIFGGAAAPGSNFDTLAGAATVGIAGDTYDGLVAADQAVATGGGTLNGWALSPQARGLLLGSKDADGRPIFINNVQTDGAVPALLGAPVYQTQGVFLADYNGATAGTDNQLGFAGDWTSAHIGVVENIQLDISTQATINDGGTQINLWQRNMFAVRAEFEVGFRVRDIAHFVRLSNAVQA
ncbi:phage major capsid protein [Microbacterium sp. NPDC088619]|uniref:phage major capsid protein n=1 Tax=Microbacterium sp. NPDC088619 TaxID=3364196 RepID=UPI0038030914